MRAVTTSVQDLLTHMTPEPRDSQCHSFRSAGIVNGHSQPSNRCDGRTTREHEDRSHADIAATTVAAGVNRHFHHVSVVNRVCGVSCLSCLPDHQHNPAWPQTQGLQDPVRGLEAQLQGWSVEDQPEDEASTPGEELLHFDDGEQAAEQVECAYEECADGECAYGEYVDEEGVDGEFDDGEEQQGWDGEEQQEGEVAEQGEWADEEDDAGQEEQQWEGEEQQQWAAEEQDGEWVAQEDREDCGGDEQQEWAGEEQEQWGAEEPAEPQWA